MSQTELTIDDLSPRTADRDTFLPAFHSGSGGGTGKVTVGQVLDLLGNPGTVVEASPAKALLLDADLVGISDSADGGELKKTTLSQFVSSVFKAARKIANGYFLSSFRLWDATDNTKGLAFNLGGVSTATTRTIFVPDADIDLGKIGIKGGVTVHNPNTAAVLITNIPAGVKRIELDLTDLTLSAASYPIIRVGSGGVIQTTNYRGTVVDLFSGTPVSATDTVDFPLLTTSTASQSYNGTLTLKRKGAGLIWTARGQFERQVGAQVLVSGKVELPGNIDRLQITTASGTPLINGVIDLSWEF